MSYLQYFNSDDKTQNIKQKNINNSFKKMGNIIEILSIIIDMTHQTLSISPKGYAIIYVLKITLNADKNYKNISDSK